MRFGGWRVEPVSLIVLLEPAGFRAGKCGSVDLRGAQGVQVGDHNSPINAFPTPPTST
jgi:hypothetical protein